MKNKYTSNLGTFIVLCILVLLSYTGTAQVGIGTTDPKTTLDVNGALSLREGPDLSLSNGNNTNINLGNPAFSHYRIVGPTAPFEIRTLYVPTPGVLADGQILTLINTTDQPMTIAHNIGSAGNPQRRIYCPGEKDFVLAGRYSSITLQYNTTDSRWYVVSFSDSLPSVDSVTLASDQEVSTSSYSNVPGMSLTFTARKPTVMVLLTASGKGYTNSMSYVQLRVRNTTSSTTVGGTNTKIQSYDFFTGTVTPWSASFSKLMTGLTVGNQYTLTVQGRVDGIIGTYNASIYPVTVPDAEHLTLSVFH